MSKSKINNEAPSLIDDYINKSPDFSRPILKKLREIIHKAIPDVSEDWKWGPNFNKNGMICGFAAFKEHVNFVFFNGVYINDTHKILTEGGSNLRTKSLKLRNVKEINEKILIEYLKESVKLNTEDKKEKVQPILEIPDSLLKALNKNKLIKDKFDKLSYTFRKEHILSITVAKKEETLQRRLLKIIDSLEEK